MNEPSRWIHTRSILERREYFRWFAGSAVLGTMVSVLYGLSTEQAWLRHPRGGAAVSVLLVMVLLALVREALTLFEEQPGAIQAKPGLLNFASVVGGGLITYVLSVYLGLGAVIASGLIGLLGALMLPEQAAAIYCGSFVGMVSPALLDGCSRVLLAAVASGIIYVLTDGTLQGFGGKLGTIAFTGTVLAGLGLRCSFVAADVPSGPLAWEIILFAMGAAVVTYWLSISKGWGPVLASSVVGLAGGLLLPPLAADTGKLLAVVVICASFTGMSSPKRVPHHLWMVVAGTVTGVVFVYSMPVLGGAGGKLGTIAFGASLGTWALRVVLDHIRLSSSGLVEHESLRRMRE